ncbi:kinase-like protein [Metschnikowia bicuspidata var. bicuspidata NRRL YB-4993]|uniref:non-specific serine/threonine protein kinase n=1 Tax=Metschnikowia bicuspidata var. bicuspidata NRRL YB-4993 TaxID=869754 RepID=A0A1A0H7Y9_9ASCO|nr:kinase-like protein [Metschnikowia bicuspidata var. bicuspidata NRRL YB-4993]OBA20100.1 kinase-like protein [Metschnikowia bicuspidata var. bicuspidata NRRL YB-4993]
MEAYEKYDHGGLLKNRYSKVSDISEGSYGLVSLAKDQDNENALVAVKYIFPVNYKRQKQYSQLSNTTGRATSSPAKLRSNTGTSDSKKKVMISALCEESSKEFAIHQILGDHPNIPKLIDHFDSCLILEYCSKGDLYEAMQNDVGPTTSQDIKDVFDQILSAIAYCHSKSVFHRDLKPENILIAQDWSIKVCDWGLATTQQIVTSPSEFDIGSERYMAPELFDPELQSYDASKVDLWSLGVILLTLVFQKNPFQVANYTDKRFLQFSANREALFDFFSSMTGEMFSSLRFCLTMDPSNRDLESFRAELKSLKYFTIDEEYWALHSEEENEAEYEDNGYEDEVEEPNLLEDLTQSRDTFPFEPEISQSASTDVRDPPSFQDDQTSAREDEVMPHNRRADALLSPTTNAKPIPIGGTLQIRNTRKPFGVASYNKNGTFFASQKNHGSYNSHSNSQGNRFRREDFFTPRSVFSHYMDKYGEQKEISDLHRAYEKKKKVWNSGRKKQSWKKRGSVFQPFNNGANHAPYMASSPPHHTPLPNGCSPASAQWGSKNAGKYVPPFLRSPHCRMNPLSVDEVSEEIDHLALTDGEVFVLEDDYHENDPRKNELNLSCRLSFRVQDNHSFFSDLSQEAHYHGSDGDSRRASMIKTDNINHGTPGKYVPPFRRSSMGIVADKRRSIIPNGSPFAGLLQTLLNQEASRSVPGENWLFKRDWEN